MKEKNLISLLKITSAILSTFNCFCGFSGLCIDEEKLKVAQRLAGERGTSVSAMFRRLIRAMACKETEKVDPGPIPGGLRGLSF